MLQHFQNHMSQFMASNFYLRIAQLLCKSQKFKDFHKLIKTNLSSLSFKTHGDIKQIILPFTHKPLTKTQQLIILLIMMIMMLNQSLIPYQILLLIKLLILLSPVMILVLMALPILY